MRISDWSSDVCSSDLTALGILGAIILGKAIHEATDDDDDDDDRRRSPPTSPEPAYPEPEVSKPPAGDPASPPTTDARQPPRVGRSEERREGNEGDSQCRSRWQRGR